MSSSTQVSSNQESVNLLDLVKQITIHYIEFYYNKFADSFPDKKVPESELRRFVDEMYETKQVDLKKYIRSSLKDNLGDKYSATATENLLLEMFADASYAKERVVQEILAKRK
jgi:hypothetical protein